MGSLVCYFFSHYETRVCCAKEFECSAKAHISKLNGIQYYLGTHRPTSIEAVKVSLEDAFAHRGWRTPSGFPWRAVALIQCVGIGGAIWHGRVRGYNRGLVITAKSRLRSCERRAEREAAQEATSTFMTVTRDRVHRLRGAGSGPRSGSTTMNPVERSGIRVLGIIYRDIGMRILGGPDR